MNSNCDWLQLRALLRSNWIDSLMRFLWIMQIGVPALRSGNTICLWNKNVDSYAGFPIYGQPSVLIAYKKPFQYLMYLLSIRVNAKTRLLI